MKITKSKVEKTWRHTNPLTYNGHEFSVVKSGLQKEARRGELENMLALAVEADASFVGLDKAKGNRTNMINRILLIMSEDICLASPGLPKQMLLLYQQWNASKGIWAQRRDALVKMVQLVAQQPKSRMISDLAAVYIKSHKIPYAQKWYPTLFDAWDCSGQEYIKLLKQAKSSEDRFGSWLELNLWKLSSLLYEQTLRHLEQLMVYVHMEHDLAFMALHQFFIQNSTPMKTASCRWQGKTKKDKIYVVWNLMHDYNEQFMHGRYQDSLDALAKIYEQRHKNRESWIFLVHGLAYLVWRSKILDYGQSLSENLKTLTDDEMYELYSGVIFHNRVKIKPYFLDKHTRIGRKTYGNGRIATIRFAIEGSRVHQEAKHLCQPIYRQLYISGNCNFQPLKKRVKITTKTGKEMLRTEEFPSIDVDLPPLSKWHQFLKPIDESKPLEPELFKYEFRAQLLTSKSRPDVTYAMYQGRPVVKKGPYLPEQMDSLRAAVYMMEVKTHYKGLLPIHCEVVYAVPTPVSQLPEPSRNPDGFGTRCRIKPGQIYPFLVMDDIARPPGLTCYPVKWKESKCWPKTAIADTSQSLGAVPKWHDPKFFQNKHAAIAHVNYILATLGSYIWQVTDTCPNNFVWIKSTGQVYRVDEENFKHPKQLAHIYKKPVSAKSKEQYMKALKLHWDRITSVLDAWKQLSERVQPTWVRKNIERIDSVEKIERLL